MTSTWRTTGNGAPHKSHEPVVKRSFPPPGPRAVSITPLLVWTRTGNRWTDCPIPPSEPATSPHSVFRLFAKPKPNLVSAFALRFFGRPILAFRIRPSAFPLCPFCKFCQNLAAVAPTWPLGGNLGEAAPTLPERIAPFLRQELALPLFAYFAWFAVKTPRLVGFRFFPKNPCHPRNPWSKPLLCHPGQWAGE